MSPTRRPVNVDSRRGAIEYEGDDCLRGSIAHSQCVRNVEVRLATWDPRSRLTPEAFFRRERRRRRIWLTLAAIVLALGVAALLPL